MIMPRDNGHVFEEKGSKNKGIIELTYLVSPANMTSIIESKFKRDEIIVEFRTTDENGNVKKLSAYEPHQVSKGRLAVTAETPAFGTVKTIALYIKENKPAGTDIMTEFTPVDSETEPVWKPEYVDLGLPSGTKWATCNVGATNPWEYGDYYAWGEIEPKSSYTWSNYKWCKGTEKTLTKYNNDSSYGTTDYKSALWEYDFVDDVARVKWGDKWRIPCGTELKELFENCDLNWMTNYNGSGVNGMLATGPSNKSIFLPAAGEWYGSSPSYTGRSGFFWTCSANTNPIAQSAQEYHFFDGNCQLSNFDRRYGMSVRPVYGDYIPMTYSEIIGSLTLHVGNVYTFTPIFHPENATDKQVTWESSNSSILRVDDHGKVTALAEGEAYIYIWPRERTAHPGQCRIKVLSD